MAQNDSSAGLKEKILKYFAELAPRVMASPRLHVGLMPDGSDSYMPYVCDAREPGSVLDAIAEFPPDKYVYIERVSGFATEPCFRVCAVGMRTNTGWFSALDAPIGASPFDQFFGRTSALHTKPANVPEMYICNEANLDQTLLDFWTRWFEANSRRISFWQS